MCMPEERRPTTLGYFILVCGRALNVYLQNLRILTTQNEPLRIIPSMHFVRSNAPALSQTQRKTQNFRLLRVEMLRASSTPLSLIK